MEKSPLLTYKKRVPVANLAMAPSHVINNRVWGKFLNDYLMYSESKDWRNLKRCKYYYDEDKQTHMDWLYELKNYMDGHADYKELEDFRCRYFVNKNYGYLDALYEDDAREERKQQAKRIRNGEDTPVEPELWHEVDIDVEGQYTKAYGEYNKDVRPERE